MNVRKPSRRHFLLGAVAAGTLSYGVVNAQVIERVEIWKDPSCGCCKDWVTHMERNGFKAVVHESGNTTKRAELGLAERFGSCHTAVIGGYVIEGHVPASDVRRLLKEKPTALGLAVPGMPVGAPGMDGAMYGGRRDPYQVLLITKDGSSQVYRSYS